MCIITASHFAILNCECARRSSFARGFARAMTPLRRDSPRENNFAPDGSTGVSAASSRRKTRESVPTDSRAQCVPRPCAAPRGVAAREIHAANFAGDESEAASSARPEMMPSKPRSDADPLLQEIVDRLRIGFAA
jgi:hypothetical protein